MATSPKMPMPSMPPPAQARLASGNEFLAPISITNHWEATHKITQKYDKGFMENWKDELEKCLIIVGLCSAPAAGFAVQYLCASPGAPTAISIFLNVSAGTTDEALPPVAPSVYISICWVLSLVVTLSAVVVGITCLQWIREYLSDSRLGPKEGLAFRQMRYDGLMDSKVPFIISILPILLQLSILLFFHGLLSFLYPLNKVVTNVVAVPIGLVWVFLVLATILPALQCIFMSEEEVRGYQCPYKSPQARLFAWVAFRFSVLVIRVLRQLGCKAESLKTKQTFLEDLIRGGSDWVSFDMTWQRRRLIESSGGSQEHEGQDIAQALAWLSRTGTHGVEGIKALYSALRDVHPVSGLEAIRKLVPDDPVSEFTLLCGHDHRHDAVLKDIMGAVLLGYSVRNNHQLQGPFFHHRVELFIRIANSLVAETMGEELEDTQELVEKYFTGALTIINPFSEDQDDAEVPNVYKHQLLMTFNAHLRASLAGFRPLPQALWDIVCPMVAQIITGYPSDASDNDLQTELNIVNGGLEAYFRHVSTTLNQEDGWEHFRPANPSLAHYINQIFTQGADVEHRFPVFWEGLLSLKSAIASPTSSRFSAVSRSDTLVASAY